MVLVATLNTKISRVRKTFVFGTVWLVGITPNAPFYPILWSFIMIFPEKLNFTQEICKITQSFGILMIKGVAELNNSCINIQI